MDARKRPRDRGNENNMARLRQAAGLTQAELASRVGVYLRTIQRWENGTTSPNAKCLAAIAQTLGCKIDDLF